jgi:DNA-binding transcriptional LysR family regulator
MLINQELLRTFVVAAESETFGEAAKRRHVTKSAISQQVKALERQLGVPLFERVGRNARLTESGGALANVLRREFHVIDEALEAVVSAKRGVEGEIRIGAPRPFARLWLRSRLSALLAAHEGLSATVAFGTPTELEAALVERKLDLILIAREPELSTVTAEAVFTERFFAYASPDYIRQRGALRTGGDGARHRFIVFDDDLPMHGVWWRAVFGRKAPFQGVVACRVSNLDEMLALAEEGVGIVVLPDYFARESLERGAVRNACIGPAARARVDNRVFLAWRTSVVTNARFATAWEALLR